MHGFLRPRPWIALLPFALGAAGALLVGCTQAADDDNTTDDHLVGGRPAGAGEFPSTLLIATNCTAAKIGPRQILTAGHCVMYPGLPSHPFFEPGATMRLTAEHSVNNASDADPAFFSVTVEQTYLSPSWVSEQGSGLNLGPNPSADVAIVVLTKESEPALAKIRTAAVDTKPVLSGDKVVVMGYGCETGIYAGFDYSQARLKVQSTVAMDPAGALAPGRTPAPNAPAAHTADNYFFTPGAALGGDSGAASLCPGDSGGPVYRDDGTQRVIVGVNSYYNFDPNDRVGVSLTNWHTRLDNDAAEGVGAWVQSLVHDDAPDGGADASVDAESDAGLDDAAADGGTDASAKDSGVDAH